MKYNPLTDIHKNSHIQCQQKDACHQVPDLFIFMQYKYYIFLLPVTLSHPSFLLLFPALPGPRWRIDLWFLLGSLPHLHHLFLRPRYPKGFKGNTDLFML